MKIEVIEETLKEIRSREDYLVNLREDAKLSVSYYSQGGIRSSNIQVYVLSSGEKEFLKGYCISEIKRLRKSIECLTD